MNYKFAIGACLAAASLAGALPLRAEQVLTQGEKDALRKYREDGSSDITDLRSDEQDTDTSPWRVGFEVLGSSPRQDFREMDSRTGFGAAIFLENELGRGFRVQSRFEFIRYPQTSSGRIGAFRPMTLSANASSLGVDVHYHLPYKGWDKVYLVAGLRAVRYEFSFTAQSDQLDPVTQTPIGIESFKDRTAMRLGTTVGFGLDINRTLSLTGRYTYATAEGFTFATFDTGLAIRF